MFGKENPNGKLGGLNCFEHLQPLPKFAMYCLGEQVHVASWPSFALPPSGPYALRSEANTAASQVYALEGQCFVLMAVAVVDDLIIETLVDTDEKSQFLQKGGGFSNVFGPDGSPLVKTLYENEEGLLFADIDLSMIVFGKWLLDPVGHYSRPDVTRLMLNPNPSPKVQYMETLMTVAEPVGTDQEEGEER
jgi:nitrilase